MADDDADDNSEADATTADEADEDAATDDETPDGSAEGVGTADVPADGTDDETDAATADKPLCASPRAMAPPIFPAPIIAILIPCNSFLKTNRARNASTIRFLALYPYLANPLVCSLSRTLQALQEVCRLLLSE